MSETQYRAAVAMVEHAGVKPNTYAQYLRWGSIAHPLRTVVHFALNWAFWYGAFYLLGGHSLAVTIFASCGVWAMAFERSTTTVMAAGKTSAGRDRLQPRGSVDQSTLAGARHR